MLRTALLVDRIRSDSESRLLFKRPFSEIRHMRHSNGHGVHLYRCHCAIEPLRLS